MEKLRRTYMSPCFQNRQLSGANRASSASNKGGLRILLLLSARSNLPKRLNDF